MHSRPEKESQEVLEVTLANARAHPWAVVILRLDAHATDAAMECSRGSHNHTRRAKRQIVCLTVWVDNPGMFEPVVAEEVGVFVSVKVPLGLGLVFDMDPLDSGLIPESVAIFAWDCWQDSWLRVRAAVD